MEQGRVSSCQEGVWTPPRCVTVCTTQRTQLASDSAWFQIYSLLVWFSRVITLHWYIKRNGEKTKPPGQRALRPLVKLLQLITWGQFDCVTCTKRIHVHVHWNVPETFINTARKHPCKPLFTLSHPTPDSLHEFTNNRLTTSVGFNGPSTTKRCISG